MSGLGDVVRVGVEHEYRLWRDGEQVDFRQLVGPLTEGLRTLDPGDPRARRLPSGVALTADGWEAELATPPLGLGQGTPERLDGLLRAERSELFRTARGAGVDGLTGFSTHLNITVPDAVVVLVGEAFARSCLGAVAEVMEPAGSAGLFVRPRRGRLEVGGEYAEGVDLVAALTLLAGCVWALRVGEPAPVTVEPALLPSREKYGWYAETPAPGQLAPVWSWARTHVIALGLDPSPVDDVAAGHRPPRRLDGADPTRCTFAATQPDAVPGYDTGQRRLASGVRAETEWLTWQHAVWLFEDRAGRRCRAVVPVAGERLFLAGVDAGEHDLVIARMLGRRWPRQRLLVHAQLDGLGWWHDVRPGALVPALRLPDGSVPRVSRRRAARDLRVRSRRVPA